MKHELLGEIEPFESDATDGVAKVRYDEREIEILIIPDDQAFETTVQLAAEIVRRMAALDKLARQIAVTDLREVYNNGWSEYDEVQDDGSLKAVSNPQLSEAEFEAKLTLTGISVTGDRVIEFFYDDEGMFWGHSGMPRR